MEREVRMRKIAPTLSDLIRIKRIIALCAVICMFFLAVSLFGHKGVLVNTVQTVSVQPHSIKISHTIDCGSKSPLNLLPVLDALRSSKIEEEEIITLANELKDRMFKRQSGYKAVLDEQVVFIPLQKLTIQNDRNGKSARVEMIFFKEALSFKKGSHNLKLEKESYQMDIPVLMAVVGYSDIPDPGHSHPAHMVNMTLRFHENFKIINSNLGFSPAHSASHLKGIFLTKQQPVFDVDFEVSSQDSSDK